MSRLGELGLSMSGGGYRAAAFHLGTLSYLHHSGLIKRLRMLSTVSGGAFIGGQYALSQVYRKPFEEFFRDAYRILQDTPLLKLTFDELAEGQWETPSGRRTLIIAMARVLERTFLKTPDGTPALLGSILESDIGLEEFVVNATELRYGLAFRFQRSTTSSAEMGNARAAIPAADAARIRFSDVVAASNCFPGGCEPIAFPDDFMWPGNRVPEGIRAAFPEPLALMDGGIYDNQGIDSLTRADDRNPIDLDLFIISDTSPLAENIYPFPPRVTPAGDAAHRVTLSTLDRAAHLIFALCALSLLAMGYDIVTHLNRGGEFHRILIYLFPFLLSSVTAFALWKAHHTVKRLVFPRIPQLGRLMWEDLKRLTVAQAIEMFQLRASSLLAVTGDVLTARIRSLTYRKLYADSRYNGKRLSTLIYHLGSDENFSRGLALAPEILPPSPRLRAVVDAAGKMPSRLWFDQEYELPSIVACGQATLCYNLMKHVRKHHGRDVSAYPEDIRELWVRLVADWNALAQEPYVLLRAMIPGAEPAAPPSTDGAVAGRIAEASA